MMNVTRNWKVRTLVWACALGWCAGVLGDGAEAAEAGVQDKQVVSVRVNTNGRSLTFDDVVVRVSDRFALAMHIDTDESNACAAAPGAMGEILL